LLLGSAVAQAAPPEPSSTTQHYVNTDFGFSVDLPRDWQESHRPMAAKAAVVQFGRRLDPSTGVLMEISAGGPDLDAVEAKYGAFEKMMEGLLASTMPSGVQVLESENRELPGDVSVFLQSLSFAAPSGRVMGTLNANVVFRRNRQVYVLTLYGPLYEVVRSRPEFESIVLSFRSSVPQKAGRVDRLWYQIGHDMHLLDRGLDELKQIGFVREKVDQSDDDTKAATLDKLKNAAAGILADVRSLNPQPPIKTAQCALAFDALVARLDPRTSPVQLAVAGNEFLNEARRAIAQDVNFPETSHGKFFLLGQMVASVRGEWFFVGWFHDWRASLAALKRLGASQDVFPLDAIQRLGRLHALAERYPRDEEALRTALTRSQEIEREVHLVADEIHSTLAVPPSGP